MFGKKDIPLELDANTVSFISAQVDKCPKCATILQGISNDSITGKARIRAVTRHRLQWLLVVVGVFGVLTAILVLLRVFGRDAIQPTLIIDVSEQQPGVFLDGEQQSVVWDVDGKRAELNVPPGARIIEIKKSGFRPFHRNVTFTTGERVLVSVPLVPEGTKKVDVARENPWQSYFNRTSLEGWESSGEGRWMIGGTGALEFRGANGKLLSMREDFANCGVRLEMTASADLEAYIGLRIQKGQGNTLDGMWSRLAGDGTRLQVGAINWDFKTPAKDVAGVLLPANEPFTLTLQAVGDELRVETNGELTGHAEYWNGEYRQGQIGIVVLKGSLAISKIDGKEGDRPKFTKTVKNPGKGASSFPVFPEEEANSKKDLVYRASGKEVLLYDGEEHLLYHETFAKSGRWPKGQFYGQWFGRYHILSKGGSFGWNAPAIAPGDFAVLVKGRVEGNPADFWGISFGLGTPKNHRILMLQINGKGECRFGPSIFDEKIREVMKTSESFRSPAIKKKEEWNRLLLLVRGRKGAFFINNEFISGFTSPLDILPACGFALIGGGPSPKAGAYTHAEFSRFTLWSLAKSSVPLPVR